MKIHTFALCVFASISLWGLPSETLENNPLRPVRLENPRETMTTFMEAMDDYVAGVDAKDEAKQEKIKDAVQTLDLKEYPSLMRAERGQVTAQLLKEVIDRVIVIDYEKIPETDPAGQPLNTWRLKNTDIKIAKNEFGDYLFTKDTVARAEDFYKKVKNLPYLKGTTGGGRYTEPVFNRMVPEWGKNKFIGVPVWQWLVLILSVFVGLILKFIVGKVIHLFKAITRKTAFRWDDQLLEASEKPIGLIVAAGFWYVVVLSLEFDGFLLKTLLFLIQVAMSVGFISLAYKLANVGTNYFAQWVKQPEVPIDQQVIPLVTRSVQVVVLTLGILAALQNLGINVASVLAGLGIGGLAFALAAKDTAANLFGSIMIFLDRPFKVGDWIKAGGVEGTVEEIGFRSTRVRTFYNSLISVPNATMATIDIDNMGLRKLRRMRVFFGLTYDTPPAKVEAFLEGVKNIIKASPYTHKDNYHVVLNKFGDSSIDVMLYCFMEVPDWSGELIGRQNVLLETLHLAEKIGVSFAFPTRTLHLDSDPNNPVKTEPVPPNAELKQTAKSFGPNGSDSHPDGYGVFTSPQKENTPTTEGS